MLRILGFVEILMTPGSIQELLHIYVDSGGKNVSIEEVEPFLNDPDPANRRIAYELMNGLTGDPLYLIKCVPILKEDPEALWEYLLDYTSELKDVFVISLLMIEGMRNIDPLRHPQKCENLIFNWARINPLQKQLPEDAKLKEKVIALQIEALPVIANIFANWLLTGYKYPLFFDLDLAPYFIENQANLSHKFPEYAWNTLDNNPEVYKQLYDKALFALYECDFVRASSYMVSSIETLLEMGDTVNAYNVLFGWYSRTENHYEENPELLHNLEELLYKIIKIAYEKEFANDQLLLMSFSLYSAMALRLVGKKYFKPERIFELSKLHEQKILAYKKLNKITYEHPEVSDKKINIGYVGMSINKGPIYASIFELMKRHDSSKFNVFYYDCGKNPAMSAQFAPELSEHVTLRTLDARPEMLQMDLSVKLAQMINDDEVHMLVYLDWLYNIVGQTVCILQPAPLNIKIDTTNISTGLSNVPYVIDFMGMLEASKLEYMEKPVTVPLPFPELKLEGLTSKRSEYQLPEDSLILYSDNPIDELHNHSFFNVISSVLENHEDTHFAFTSYSNPQGLLNKFEEKQLHQRVSALPYDGSVKAGLEKILMCDIYLDAPGACHAQGVYSAMSMSKPVISIKPHRCALISERIAPAMLSIDLCVAENLEDFEDKLTRMVESEDLRTKTGKELKEFARQKFNIATAIMELEKHYLGWFL